MRRFVLILAVMGAVVLCSGRGSSQSLPTVPPGSLVGMLVDGACFAIRGAAVMLPDHAQCAIACALKGHRLTLVTATGTVYMVTGVLTQNDNAKLIPLINRAVVVVGTVSTIQPTAVQDTAPPGDGRRPSGSQEGVATQRIFRKGDFREGDVQNGPEMIIDAISVDLIKIP